MNNRNLIETENKGIYRDPESRLLIIKDKKDQFKTLANKIKVLEERIRKIEEILLNK